MQQIFTGLLVEGTTDDRFFKGVLRRSLDDIAFDCTGQIEIELFSMENDRNPRGFVDQVLSVAKKGWEDYSISILFVHTDADSANSSQALVNKILPAQEALVLKPQEEYCRVLVPIIPIQMMESWLLADKDLLKEEIGTELSNRTLGITRPPESIADPKVVIEEAIRKAREGLTKRKRGNLNISELYAPIGAQISLKKLEKLSSYRKFQADLKEAFITLNLLHE